MATTDVPGGPFVPFPLRSDFLLRRLDKQELIADLLNKLKEPDALTDREHPSFH